MVSQVFTLPLIWGQAGGGVRLKPEKGANMAAVSPQLPLPRCLFVCSKTVVCIVKQAFSPLSPGRVELLLGLSSQVVFAQQEAGRHGSGTQTGQQHGRVAARYEARKRVCHLSARVSSGKQVS